MNRRRKGKEEEERRGDVGKERLLRGKKWRRSEKECDKSNKT